jgi:hypothetical protein
VVSESDTHELAELPIACTLDAGAGAERMARWRALSARAAPGVRRADGELVVAYPRAPGVREELERLAAAERRCCAFAHWEVVPDRDQVVLRISADGEGLAAIARLFGAG